MSKTNKRSTVQSGTGTSAGVVKSVRVSAKEFFFTGKVEPGPSHMITRPTTWVRRSTAVILAGGMLGLAACTSMTEPWEPWQPGDSWWEKEQPAKSTAAVMKKQREAEAARAAMNKRRELAAARDAMKRQKETEAARAALKKQQQAEAARAARINEQEAKTAKAAMKKQQKEEAARAAMKKRQEAEAARAANLKQRRANAAAMAKRQSVKNMYFGASVGQSSTDASGGGYDRDMAELGYTTVTDLNDTRGLGWKVFGGYEFTRNWAIEGAYVNLDDVDSDTTVSAGPPGFTTTDFVTAAATKHPYDVQGFAITGKGTYPIAGGFSVFAKAGVFLWQADTNVSCINCAPPVSEPDGESGEDFTGGAGFSYAFGNNMEVRAEWEHFGTDRDDLQLISASALIRF